MNHLRAPSAKLIFRLWLTGPLVHWFAGGRWRALSSYEPLVVDARAPLRLKVRARRRVPYEKVCELLAEGHEVFMAGMPRSTASRVRRALSRMMGCEVVAYPSELDGQPGYAFKVSLVQALLERLSQQAP